MIMGFDELRGAGGFLAWNRFHDCFLCEYQERPDRFVMVLERLYDWDAKRNTQKRVVVSAALPPGRTCTIDGNTIVAFIGEMNLDFELGEITCYFSDAFLRIPVEVSRSYLIELSCDLII